MKGLFEKEALFNLLLPLLIVLIGLGTVFVGVFLREIVNIMGRILFFLWTTLFILLIYGLFLHYRFLKLLKENHPEKWKELGSPTLIWNNSIQNTLKILAFLKNKEYLKINDQELTKKAKFLWSYNIIYFIVFITIICLFLIM